jgi:restriction system protein
MTNVWMIRGESGRLYDEFRERGAVGIGWNEIASRVQSGASRKQLADLYRAADPTRKPGSVIAGASQVWRFVNEIQVGDGVVTYSPANRTYLVGQVSGPFQYRPDWADDGMGLSRPIAWRGDEVGRDDLSTPTRNSLGSTLTVFLLPPACAAELMAVASGGSPTPVRADDLPIDETPVDPLEGVELAAIERIKDTVNRLDWEEMQDLIAGLLRAMGYKTQVSPAGPDRGKDIIASPDGFGFENPRIVVEVKHRRGQMGSASIRSFLGGRHKDDRGLFVSTGGFSRDAYYEADRASVPLTLWTLDNLVRALVEHYDTTDAETKRLVPLKRLYVPA